MTSSPAAVSAGAGAGAPVVGPAGARPQPAAQLLAERIGAVRLPAPVRRRGNRGPHPGLGAGVVVVATGAGIEPVLPWLRADRGPARLLWIADNPRAIYGDALVDEVLATPCRPTVWDTARLGEPDLVRLAYAAYASCGAAAVVCVADRVGTGRLVRALARRGVPVHAGVPELSG